MGGARPLCEGARGILEREGWCGGGARKRPLQVPLSQSPEELFAKVENNTNIARIRPEYSCSVEASLKRRIADLEEQDNVIYFLFNGSRILQHLLTNIGIRHLKYYLATKDAYGCTAVVNRTEPYSNYIACLFV
ncbi:unnamed protein product [Cylicocyclus nassatus]|uniref:Uncharacterized protein n=1 Tax=Cylicocyclus nassatus TaxID=53992 RepID=A0AA36GKZ6_CYLNA|nr:unnamed protein product [Cylicocyclus nassatus]